ncbi:MAG TPA: cupredoxin domain-containing protein [Acidimicrobiia bacterium]|nr:cupredoxin domain-containing protein [Acidimicrobiia bacterium]
MTDPRPVRKRRARAGPALAVALVLAPGCGSREPVGPGSAGSLRSAAPIDRVAVVIEGAAYRPAVFSARAGRPMVVSLLNRDDEAHDFIVPGLPDPVHLFMTAHKDIVSSLTFPTPGEYVFYCSLRAHRSAGMEGRVVVDG